MLSSEPNNYYVGHKYIKQCLMAFYTDIILCSGYWILLVYSIYLYQTNRGIYTGLASTVCLILRNLQKIDTPNLNMGEKSKILK